MSFVGVCGICGAAPADRQCEFCGTLVCEEHYDPGRGACVDCAGVEGFRGARF